MGRAFPMLPPACQCFLYSSDNPTDLGRALADCPGKSGKSVIGYKGAVNEVVGIG
jgi:hypothetical protein